MATNTDKMTIIKTPRSRKDLREAVEDVFDGLGGTAALIAWAGESTVNRRIFYKDILTKVIPKHVQGEFGGIDGKPIKMVVEWAGDSPVKESIPSANQLMQVILDADGFSDDEE